MKKLLPAAISYLSINQFERDEQQNYDYQKNAVHDADLYVHFNKNIIAIAFHDRRIIATDNDSMTKNRFAVKTFI